MNALVFVAALAAVAFSRAGRSVPRGTVRYSRTLPPGRVTWRGDRDAFALSTWEDIAAALPNETALQNLSLRASVAAAFTALAANETGWGRSEREHNPFNLHASSGPRFRVGREVLRLFSTRAEGIRAAVSLLVGDRYRAALDELLSELDAGESPDVAAANWIQRLVEAGYAEPWADAPRTREALRAVASGVLARLRAQHAPHVPQATPGEGQE